MNNYFFILIIRKKRIIKIMSIINDFFSLLFLIIYVNICKVFDFISSYYNLPKKENKNRGFKNFDPMTYY